MLGSLAIITLFSNQNNQGKGFLLSYEALMASTAPDVDFSTNIILSGAPEINLTYPGDNSYYRNNELSTFVYSPDHSYDNSITVQADYRLNSLEGSCYDFVTVYRFQSVANANGTGWSFVER
jgi:hypothetical protein